MQKMKPSPTEETEKTVLEQLSQEVHISPECIQALIGTVLTSDKKNIPQRVLEIHELKGKIYLILNRNNMGSQQVDQPHWFTKIGDTFETQGSQSSSLPENPDQIRANLKKAIESLPSSYLPLGFKDHIIPLFNYTQSFDHYEPKPEAAATCDKPEDEASPELENIES